MITVEGELKLIDFGLANNLAGDKGDGWQISCVGTSEFMSPELIVGERYKGNQADFFALAVVLFTMYANIAPWKYAKKDDQTYRNLACER